MIAVAIAAAGGVAAAAASSAGARTPAAGSPTISIPGLGPKPPPVVAPPAPGLATVDYGYDAAHDFAAADPSIAAPLGSLWSADVQGDPVQLVAADKMIFALVTRTNAAHVTSTSLLSLDPVSGHVLWNLLVPNSSQIAYASGVVAVAGGGQVQAFKASSGANLWSVGLQGAAAITPADGEFYVDADGDATTAQSIDAINVTSGKVTWTASGVSPTGAGPLGVAGDRVYRADQNHAQAFNRTNGKLIWQVGTASGSAAAATATLWNQEMFASPFVPGGGAPAASVGTQAMSDANGGAFGADTAAIASGDTGLAPTPQGTIADDLATSTVIWSAYTHPLAILNDDAVTFGKNAIELRALASGKLAWYATMAGKASETVTAVGNGELLVGTGGHVTALLAYGNSAVPKVVMKPLPAYATYKGPPAKVSGVISQPGIEQSYEFAIAGRPQGKKAFGKPRLTHTHHDGTVIFSEHPERDTIYRISLPDSDVPLSLFEIVALPKVGYHFGTPTGNRGQVTITVSAPPRITLGGHKASLYIGRAKSKRYFLLGTGHLHGKKGSFTASFPFKLEKHVGKKDFVTACFVGLYKQGMSYGDHLDHRCGDARIPF